MAEASSSNLEATTPIEESPSSDEERAFEEGNSERRRSHFDNERTSNPGRIVRGSTQATSSSKGARVGDQKYKQPAEIRNLSEDAAPPPASIKNIPLAVNRGANLENVLSRGGRSPTKCVSSSDERSPIFSASRNLEQRSISALTERQNLTETAIPPPVESVSELSSSLDPTAQERLEPLDVENEDADEQQSPSPIVFAHRQPRNSLQTAKAAPLVPRWLTELYTISYLIFFSILGTLARLGIQWLTFYPGAPVVTPVIWANMAGSLFMGFLAEDQRLFRDGWISPTPVLEPRSNARSGVAAGLDPTRRTERTKRKKTIPFYIGLATGFCGSFTSFSSFARDYFLALSNNLPTPINHPYAPTNTVLSTTSTVDRNGGYSFMAFAAVVIATVALSLGGLIFGAHLALFLDPVTPQVSVAFCRRFLDPVMIVLGWGCWIGAVLLCIWPPDRPAGPSSHGTWPNETWRGEVLFAIAFAPLGCLLRFYASLKLNGLVTVFPLGTFAVNMLGTAVEGMSYDVQHVRVGLMGAAGGGTTGCQVLQGIMDGFCGCLTTVSTWVAEMNGLQRRHAYAYALASIFGGLCLMVIIMGSVKWSVGWSAPVCNTGYTSKMYG